MQARNPYAPSKASLEASETPAAAGGVWRDHEHVIVAHGASFPRRCVKCNALADEPGKVRRVYWHHPTIYLLFLIYVVVYLVVALAMRKSMEIDPRLCEEHVRERRKWITIGWLGSLFGLLGIPVIGALVRADIGPVLLLAFTCFLVCAVMGSRRARILYPKRIDRDYARLKGADPRFLASLPKFL